MRTDNTWDTGPSGTYVRIIKPGGMDVLINGTDRYWNFAVISGFAGYGFRDNAGTIEFKNSGGAWTPAATALAYTAENVANKSTNVTTDGTSDTKYPSVKAVKDYADGLVAGLLDYRGAYDASVNTFPASGGSGTAGAIMKGDMWVVSVAGTLGGVAIQIGDYIIANTDTPAQTASKWDSLNTNIGYVPEDAANKVTSISALSTDTQYGSAKLLFDQLAGKISTYGSTTAKYFLAAPNAGDGTPSFRAIVASDIPALSYAAPLGADDNYVSDAQLIVLGNTSNTNTGDNATNTQYSGLASSKLDANFLSLGSLADPNINALMAWDDTDGALKFLTIGTGLSYDHTTHTLSSPDAGGTVTSVAALTLGTTGTDLSSSVANGTSTPVITLNIPTASATNRGALSSTDWSTFNAKQPAMGTDDNYVTDAQLVVIQATSGANTGDNATNSQYSGLASSKQNALSGTGFVKITGTTISYDNSTYLTSVTAHNLLSTTHGDTTADTVVRGDIITGQGATPKWARLAFPATPTGKVLIASATDIGWSASALGTAAYTASTAYDVAGAAAAITPTTLGLVIGTNVLAQRTFGSAANSATTDFAAPLSGTINEIAYFASASTIGSLAVATYPSLTELAYVKGVTSGIQGQLNGKQASGSYLVASDITGKMDIIADPNANRLYGWDDTDNAYKYFTIGSNLSYNHSTYTLSAIGGTGGSDIIVTTVGDIQTQLDLVYAAGGGIVFLAAGTYTLTADILIPSGVTLQGISRDSVIINCDGTYAVKIAGTNVYSTGTVTINNGATALVGSGTTWTDGMIGRYVLLDGLWYEITAFTDTTHITIAAYQGLNLVGSAYVLADTNFNASLNKVTVTGATGSGVVVAYALEPNLNDIYVYGCGTGIDMDYVTFPVLFVGSEENGVNLDMNFVEGFTIDYSAFNFSTVGAGVVMTNTKNANFYSSSIADNTGNGISLTNVDKIPFLGLDISGNGACGIEFISGCDDNQITNCNISDNTTDGVKLTATSDRNQILGSSILNSGGYGINIAASTCDNNVVNEITYSGNVSGTLSDSGTGTSVVSGTNTGDAAANSTANTYADGKVADAINDGTTTIAPSQNAVFDALALKAPLTAPTFATSITGSYLTASEILITDASKNIVSAPVATYPSLTELTYLKGVTSAIQTQINAKGAGTVTAVSVATANGVSGSSSGGATPALTIALGAITPTTVNALTLASQAIGFTLAGGTTSKTLTVPLDASVSGTNTGDQDLSGLVTKATYDAYSILMATTDNTPVAITIAEQTMVGRITGGAIKALSTTEIRTLINVADGATNNTKATGAEVDTGTDDAKFVTAKAMEDSAYIKSGVALPLAGGTMTGKIVSSGSSEVGKTYAPASGAQTVALDCALNNVHVVSGNASGTAITFTVANATNSQPFIVSILQGGTTVSTITAWFATIRWAGGVAPTLTATLNKRDTFGFIRTGANTYDGFIIGQNA